MAALMPQGKQQYFTAGGIPLVGGKVYTYAAGTTTPLATYTTAAASTPNTNPVILDSRGEASIFFSAANYKVVLKDSLDSTIWTQDNLPGDQAATIVANLAASSGSSLVGHIASGTGAVATTVQAKLRESVSVKDFGAVGDGVTDDTVAIALALATFNIGVAGGGGKLVFPRGTYLCQIELVGTINNYMGQYGLCLSGYGATLKGRPGDTSIIKINHAVVGTPDPNPGGSIYCNGLTIEGFTFVMTGMANATSTYAIAMHHVYNSSLRDLFILEEPNLGGGLFIGSQCYTIHTSTLACGRMKIQGHDGVNLTTTLTFTNVTLNQVVLSYVFGMSFFGGVIQGSIDHFDCLTDVQSLNVFGMDLEGTGGVVYKFGTNCRNVNSVGNSCGGYVASTYSSGFAAASNLSDRLCLTVAGGSLGTYGKIGSQGLVTVTSPTVTPIYQFFDVQANQNMGLVMVVGDNGSNGWQDLIMVFSSIITIVSSNTTYGSPPTRTYTAGSNVLNVSLSAGTYNVRAVVSEFLSN